MSVESQLYAIVQQVYERHNDRPSVSPSWLATEAMVDIDFPRSLHEIGYIGCHLQMRQIARSFCRKRFEDMDKPEDDLFNATLQHRYPRAARSGEEEPEYILLDMMARDDVAYNVARLRKEADAKLRHADALEAWGYRKFGRAA